MNTLAIQKRMIDKHLKIADLAKAINKTYPAAHAKLYGISSLTLVEAEQWQRLLDISDEQFVFYFMES